MGISKAEINCRILQEQKKIVAVGTTILYVV